MSSQIVLMTGCSSGIGLATTTRLAHDPDHRFVIIATVIAMSEKDDLVAAVRDKLDKTVFIKKLDVTDDGNITSIVDDVIKTHGRIDVLLNIAGTGVFGVIERVTRQQMEHVFNVNTFGAIRLAQAVLPGMKKRRAGKIIVVSSLSGIVGWPYSDIYASSKSATEGFFVSLAASARSFNIRVCVFEPTLTITPLYHSLFETNEAQAVDESIDELDRRHLTDTVAVVKNIKTDPPSDVAQAIVTQCLDVDEPVFRHMLAGELKADIEQAVGDLTGEATVALGRKFIGAS